MQTSIIKGVVCYYYERKHLSLNTQHYLSVSHDHDHITGCVVVLKYASIRWGEVSLHQGQVKQDFALSRNRSNVKAFDW